MDFIRDTGAFLEQELQEPFHTSSKIYHTGTEMAKLTIHGNDKCLRFLDWLYDGASVKLDRKYQKYLLLKDFVRNRNLRRSRNKNMLAYKPVLGAEPHILPEPLPGKPASFP